MARTRQIRGGGPASDDALGPSSLHKTPFKSNGKALATNASVELRYDNVHQLSRPAWPENDDVTPEMSLRKIRGLESGNDDEKLMALFARHVIRPGRNNRKGRWVSKRTLRKLFPEHFDEDGFVTGSTWQHKKASDFGLPDIFFRGVDSQRALIGRHDSVNDMFTDLGRRPALEALTHDERQWLLQRNVYDEQGSSINVEQSSTRATLKWIMQDTSTETGLAAEEDDKMIAQSSEHPEAIPSVKSQSRSNAEAPTIPEVTPCRDLITPIKLESTESVRSEHRTSSSGPDADTPRTAGVKGDHTHTVVQKHSSLEQPERANTTSKSVESARPLVADDMRAVKTILMHKVCDILKDFPTAPDDEFFLPLLAQLVKATVANLPPQVVVEKHLDLSTHVIVHCTSSSPTHQMETSSLVRPVLRILSRHRHRLAAHVHSQLQRDLNVAARAADLGRLRAIYAQLLLLEAHYDESQTEH